MIVMCCSFVVGVAAVKAESPLDGWTLKMAKAVPDFLVDAGPDLI
jgi:hypothetical protein